MQYKTVFIDAPMLKGKSAWGMSIDQPNGDQLTRDTDAAIFEKSQEGYELCQAMPVTSAGLYASSQPYSFTSGIMLIFKKHSE